jgi:hypothetical protein
MPIKAPKGAASASDSKAVKINSTSEQMQKKRRSHDPNRSLNSLPAAQLVKSNYVIEDTQTMSKGLLIVLMSLAGINKVEKLPNGRPKHLKQAHDYSPTITNFDDFVSWVKTLTLDSNGFIIVTLSGSTGVGTCISRGQYMGNAFHITSGGLTYTNKKGSHILLCGTNSERAAHAFVDLSDPFVKNIVPALNRLGVIKIDLDVESKNNGNEHDEIVSFDDDISTDVSYPLMIDVAKIINPFLKYKRANIRKNPIEKKKIEPVKKKVEDYMASMNLPSDNDEDADDADDGDKDQETREKAFKTVRINDSIVSFKKNYEEGNGDSQDDDDENQESDEE